MLHPYLPPVDPAESAPDFRAFYPYTPNEVKHRKRTTSTQLRALENVFRQDTKPNAAIRNQLAEQLKMTPRGVQVWFQNRRAKEKTKASKAKAAVEATKGGDDGSPSITPQVDLPSPASASAQSPNADITTEVSYDDQQTPAEQQSENAVSSDCLARQHQQPANNPPPIITPPQLRVFTDSNQSDGHLQHAASVAGDTLTNLDQRSNGLTAAELYAQRRGSLPAHVLQHHPVSPLPPDSASLLQRRRSVDVNLQRFISNPYATLARAKTDAVGGSRPQRVMLGRSPPLSRASHNYQQQQRLGVYPSPSMSHYMNLRRASMDSRALLASQRGTALPSTLSTYQNPRASLPISNSLYPISTRTFSPPEPGPLPLPNFQFGAASSTPAMASPGSGDSERNSPDSPHSFMFREDDDDDGTSAGPISRFSSIASVDTSESSSYYSDFTSPNSVAPSPTILSGRRNSCTPAFVGLMSTLGMSDAAHGNMPESIIQGPYLHEEAHVTSNKYIDTGPPVNSNIYPLQSSTVSTGSVTCLQDSLSGSSIPISRSSELAYALESKPEVGPHEPESHLMFNSFVSQSGPSILQQDGSFYYIQEDEASHNGATGSSSTVPGYKCTAAATHEQSYNTSYVNNYSLTDHAGRGIQTPMDYTQCTRMSDVYSVYGDPTVLPSAVFAADENSLQSIEHSAMYA
ncbi:hypothetical protein AX17_004483 [Amanita inopinata Kibby_2008]|nr:hypothetical protein AX17_004483 [Amanita inopinata Kibby_2008]